MDNGRGMATYGTSFRGQGLSSVGDIHFLSCTVATFCTVLFAPIFLTEGLFNLDLHLVVAVA
jgi:hypothetical protein